MKKIFVFILLSLVFVACNPKEDENILATIDTYKVTKEEFYQRLDIFKGLSEERKREEFESIVEKYAEIVYGLQIGIEKDVTVKTVTGKNLKMQLANDELYRDELSKFITEPELQDLYEKRKFKVNAAHILVASKEKAQEIRNKIINGEDFGKLAKENSLDTTTAKTNGEIGEFVWGEMVAVFEDSVFAMEVGELSEPVKSDYGFHIIKLLSKNPNPQKPFDEERTKLVEALLKIKSFQINFALEELKNKLYEPAQIKINVENLEKYFRTVTENSKNLPEYAKLYFNDPTIGLEKMENIVLATYKKPNVDASKVPAKLFFNYLLEDLDGTVTVGDLIIDVRQENRSKVFLDKNILESAVTALAKNDLLVGEAINRGLAQKENVLALGESVFEDQIYKQTRRKILGIGTEVSEKEIKDYYEKHKQDYQDAGFVDLKEVWTEKQEIANLILQKSKTEDFDKIIKNYQTQVEVNSLSNIPLDANLEAVQLAKAYKVGEVYGPVLKKSGFAIYQITGKIEPAPLSFEKIKRRAEKDARKSKKINDEKALTETVAKNVKIEINQKAFEEALKNYVEKPTTENQTETKNDKKTNFNF
ncbi:peptidyl-prolyl cis-trans isomerase [bacterium]|nr:peptidyl-prolyl cis-trans isomerase [bacterium]